MPRNYDFDASIAEPNPVSDFLTVAAAIALMGGAYWWWSNRQTAPVREGEDEGETVATEGAVEETVVPTEADVAPIPPAPPPQVVIEPTTGTPKIVAPKKPRIRRVLASTLFGTMKIPRQKFRFKKVGENKTTGTKLFRVKLPDRSDGGPKQYNFEVSADHRTAKRLLS